MRRAFLIFVGLILFLIIIQANLIFNTNAKDLVLYELLVKSSNPTHNIANTKHLATQKRGKTTKNLTLGKGPFPLKASLQSDSSILRFHHYQDSTSIEEEMLNCFGMIQNELFYQNQEGDEFTIAENGLIYSKDNQKELLEKDSQLIPMQRLRTFLAEKALYNYQNNSLASNNVEIVDYIAYGHKLSWPLDRAKALLNGVGEGVKISFSQGGPDFQATRLRLNLLSKKIP